MDLNLKAMIGVTYLIPIAITLRKVYAPNFDIPEAFTAVLSKLDAPRVSPGYRAPRSAPMSHDLHV